MALQIPTADDAVGCSFCSQIHENMNTPNAAQPNLCHVCKVCWQLCEHTALCRWPSSVTESPKPAISESEGIKTNKTLAFNPDLKDAFESWFVTFELDKHIKKTCDEAWADFAIFANEVLTPVDASKRYIVMAIDGEGNIDSFKFTDTKTLFTDQNGDFVQVNNKIRVRLGKNVAVL